MIAQPILTAPAAAKPSSGAQLPQPANNNGFLSLLSATDPTLMDLAQNMGTTAPGSGSAVNAAKTKANDASAAAGANPTSNVAPLAAPASTAAPLLPPAGVPSPGGNQLALNAAPVPRNALLPAPGTATGAGQNASQAAANAALGAAGTPPNPTGTGSDNGTNGNSTAFGADQVNARVVAAAPIIASQPAATMASVPPHLLDAATPHPQPGAPSDKTDDDAPQKASATTSAAPPAPADAAGTSNANAASQLPTTHAAPSDQGGSFAAAGANGSTPTSTADTSSTSGNAADASTAGTPLPTQPNAPLAPPVQADAAVHTAAPYLPVGEQIALNLKQALAADNNEIRIQLKPASLGTIDVKLNLTQDGRVSAVISADRSDTLNLLKQDSGTLQQSLRNAGLNADSNSLSFSLRGDSQSFAQNSFQGSGQQSSGGFYRGTAAASFARANPAIPALRFHSGTVDIQV